MNDGRMVFSQLMDFLPIKAFRRCVSRYPGRYRVRRFSDWDQFLAMVFAQITYREGLRDIEACLGAVPEKLYHLGFRARVTRSTLADADERRDWRIYTKFAHPSGVLLAVPAARLLRAGLFGVAPYDPMVFGSIVAVLIAAAWLGCWVPARRATRINPLEALVAE